MEFTLKLLSADKAALYGLKPVDQSEANALRDLLDMGFMDALSARQHIDAAIVAGAFERIEVSAEKSKGKKEQTA